MKHSIWLILGVVASVSVVGAGCGGSSGSDTTGGGGGGGSSVAAGNSIVSTPQGSALNYSFTATAVEPTGTTRFLAGTFPIGNQPGGGNCPGIYSTGGYAYFCNARILYSSILNVFAGSPVLGQSFGTINPGISGVGSNQRRSVDGYYIQDGFSMVTLGINRNPVSCNTPLFNPSNGSYNCDQITVSGVISLSAIFIRENLGGVASLSNIALDISSNSLTGIIFVMTSPGHGAHISISPI